MSERLRVGLVINPTAGKNTGARIGREAASLLAAAGHEIVGTRHETKAMLVAVANGPAYGGGMKVVPEASYDDGMLDVLILHEVSIPTLLRVFPKVFKGEHVSHPAVEILRGRRVRLEASGIVSYADGERFEPLPLDCEVVPGAVTVLT